MTPEQANALLTLIADLARIIYAPPPPVEPDPSTNGATTREHVTSL
jgi:hypothetical protein